MINYTWTISAFDCTPEKVVTSIHWRYKGVNENNTSHEIYGVIAVGEPAVIVSVEIAAIVIEAVALVLKL